MSGNGSLSGRRSPEADVPREQVFEKNFTFDRNIVFADYYFTRQVICFNSNFLGGSDLICSHS